MSEAELVSLSNFYRLQRVQQVRAQLYVALDRNYVDAQTFQELNQLASQVSRMISGLMAYLKQSGIRGTKYKQASEST